MIPKIKLSDYTRGVVRYSYSANYFVHNVEHDYQLVLVHEEHSAKFKTLLESKFKIIVEYDLSWTKKNKTLNMERLGLKQSSVSSSTGQDEFKLRALIFEIEHPQYELTSTGIYTLPWQKGFSNDSLRDIILASDSIELFFNYLVLLVGLDNTQNLMSHNFDKAQVTDLAGAEGWKSFQEMISVANICSDWVVMRNAEFLPDNFWGNDKDIDILCRNLPPYLMAVNATKKSEGISNFEVIIEDQSIDVDARFIGDDYYDRLWQEDMLTNKAFKGTVPLLNGENYFFSLLYHSRIHKNVVKPIYIPRLHALAKSLGFIMNEHVLSDDSACAKFMDGYFASKGYKFTYPLDFACYENINRRVTRYIKQYKPMCFNMNFEYRLMKKKLFLYACKLLPRSLKDNLKRVLNK